MEETIFKLYLNQGWGFGQTLPCPPSLLNGLWRAIRRIWDWEEVLDGRRRGFERMRPVNKGSHSRGAEEEEQQFQWDFVGSGESVHKKRQRGFF
jgi:hypothetical protein